MGISGVITRPRPHTLVLYALFVCLPLAIVRQEPVYAAVICAVVAVSITTITLLRGQAARALRGLDLRGGPETPWTGGLARAGQAAVWIVLGLSATAVGLGMVRQQDAAFLPAVSITLVVVAGAVELPVVTGTMLA